MMLRWEQIDESGWWAYSGELVIGMVGTVKKGPRAGDCYWRIAAVHTNHICKGSGDVKTHAAAKRALERAWGIWLEHAGLVTKGK